MNRWIRRTALVLLALLAIAAVVSLWLPGSAAVQYRDAIDAVPSARFPLGTDELGRDRLAQLLCGIRISFLLAPAAALFSTLIAALIGGTAGWCGGRIEWLFMVVADVFVSLPWLFLLITVRAILPLDVSAAVSIVVTFLLLGILGWAAPARVVRARARAIRQSEYVLYARACGAGRARLFVRQLIPDLRSILAAQFWICLPVYVISEANLGLLGLGVTDPLVSLGGMVRALQSQTAFFARPWILAPAAVLVLAPACLHFARLGEDRAS
ncbi:MAG TPA: ABC transporter permease [Bryobacteraceae bacterium]|nr:ABC transporter permease [Bryobacteraceae bacterium]